MKNTGGSAMIVFVALAAAAGSAVAQTDSVNSWGAWGVPPVTVPQAGGAQPLAPILLPEQAQRRIAETGGATVDSLPATFTGSGAGIPTRIQANVTPGILPGPITIGGAIQGVGSTGIQANVTPTLPGPITVRGTNGSPSVVSGQITFSNFSIGNVTPGIVTGGSIAIATGGSLSANGQIFSLVNSGINVTSGTSTGGLTVGGGTTQLNSVPVSIGGAIQGALVPAALVNTGVAGSAPVITLVPR